MIEIKNLRKVFDNGFEALKDINLEIEEGDLVCLLGPSGCGKSTILNLISGLLDPTEGDILFEGQSVKDLHPKDRGIGLVFQNYALYPHMTVLENVMFPLTVGKNKMSKEEAKKIAEKYMKITDIEELADKKPGTMSGGQQQRLDPTEGDILFEGQSVKDLHPKDRGIGLVFQNYALYPHMTVLENVMFPLTVGKNKMSKEEAKKIAEKYMKITDIEELADKKPGTMSGGQQQRVAITRALVQNPKVLLLDEPLSNLDARLRLRIREEIRLLVKEIGITTIFVTHDQEEALSISDKIVLMDNGVVQQYDMPYNLYLDPINLFVAKFMGNPIINLLNMKFKNNEFISDDLKIESSKLLKDKIKKQFEEDKNYVVGVRPEHFLIQENEDADTLKVKVQNVELIGKDAIVSFKLNGKYCKTITDVNRRIQVGDEVIIKLDYDTIHIFDESGERIY